MKNITTIILFTLLAFASLNSNAQRTASLIIDSTSIKFQGDLSLPYWVNAGKTVALGIDAVSVSILEFNIDSSDLTFNQVIHLTLPDTVPSGKAWKIEAIGLRPTFLDISSNGSTPIYPSIFSSPVTFSNAGTHSWTVPPGITQICVEVWGGGGMGGRGFSSPTRVGGGGGGGSYGYECFSVLEGVTYTVVVGNGQGGSSSFGNVITANGGANGGSASSTAAGSSGNGGTCSAGYNISGSDGTSTSSWCGPSTSAKGGDAGNGGLGGDGWSTKCVNGSTIYYEKVGGFPGGGGGGGKGNGAMGGSGQVKIYF